MQGQVYRITGTNPRLTMEAARLLEDAGLADRNVPGCDLFACFGPGGEVTGVAGGRMAGTECLVLFLAVADAQRGEGTGSALLSRVLQHYAGECDRAWVLAEPDTAGFFEGFGFESRPSGSIPAAIRDSRALAGTEIAAKETMVLELPKRWPAV